MSEFVFDCMAWGDCCEDPATTACELMGEYGHEALRVIVAMVTDAVGEGDIAGLRFWCDVLRIVAREFAGASPTLH